MRIKWSLSDQLVPCNDHCAQLHGLSGVSGRHSLDAGSVLVLCRDTESGCANYEQ